MIERNALVAKRKAEEIALDKAKAKRKKEVEGAVEMVLLLVAISGLLTLVAWGTAQYVDFMKA